MQKNKTKQKVPERKKVPDPTQQKANSYIWTAFDQLKIRTSNTFEVGVIKAVALYSKCPMSPTSGVNFSCSPSLTLNRPGV